MASRLPWCLALDKLKRVFRVVAADTARLVAEGYTITLVGHVDNLRSEGRADELCTGLLRQRLQQLGHCCSVLGVEVGVDLVKNDKGATLSALECENQAKGTQT